MDRTLIASAMILDGSGAAPFSGDVLVAWAWATQARGVPEIRGVSLD